MSARHGDDPARGIPAASEDAIRFFYLQYAKRVRRYLAGFGVAPAELDDLTQEVFLIVMSKHGALAEIDQVGPWLREIARKLAAGQRRRGSRARTFSVEHAAEALADTTPTQASQLEERQSAEQLQRAMAALGDEDRDLIALHELGGLPLVAVAELVERDRKTVRKRIAEANRKLSRLVRAQEVPRAHPNPLTRFAVPAAASARVRREPARFLGKTEDVVIGRVGAVLVAVWPGAPTVEALTLLGELMHATSREFGTGLVYLSIVEQTTSTPSLEARKLIIRMLQEQADNVGVYPHVLLGGMSWIVRPIMAGLAFLSGVPGSMPFFTNVERAAAWINAGYLRGTPDDQAAIVQAVTDLRAIAAERDAPSQALAR